MAVLICGVYYKKHRSPVVPTPVSQMSGLHVAKVMRLLPNENFEFILEDGSRIHARLRGDISPDSRDDVIRLMNNSKRGKIDVVCHHRDGTMVVDVLLTQKDNSEVNLWDWLLQRNLTYQTQKPN